VSEDYEKDKFLKTMSGQELAVYDSLPAYEKDMFLEQLRMVHAEQKRKIYVYGPEAAAVTAVAEVEKESQEEAEVRQQERLLVAQEGLGKAEDIRRLTPEEKGKIEFAKHYFEQWIPMRQAPIEKSQELDSGNVKIFCLQRDYIHTLIERKTHREAAEPEQVPVENCGTAFNPRQLRCIDEAKDKSDCERIEQAYKCVGVLSPAQAGAPTGVYHPDAEKCVADLGSKVSPIGMKILGDPIYKYAEPAQTVQARTVPEGEIVFTPDGRYIVKRA